MKMLILALCTAGLFSACECYDDDLYRCAYERPRVFDWQNYDEYEKTCTKPCPRFYPAYADTVYVRVYKGPVYYYNCRPSTKCQK